MSLMYCKFCRQTQLGRICFNCGSPLIKRGSNEKL